MILDATIPTANGEFGQHLDSRRPIEEIVSCNDARGVIRTITKRVAVMRRAALHALYWRYR
jgi:hypothetical protein